MSYSIVDDSPWMIQETERYRRFFDRSALFTLAHNLAIVAALCASFDLAWHGRMDYSDRGRSVWRPNTDGKAAV